MLVHCHAGMSRSASTVIYYLMHFEGWCLAEALGHCRACRPVVKPNPGFYQQLLLAQQQLTTMQQEQQQQHHQQKQQQQQQQKRQKLQQQILPTKQNSIISDDSDDSGGGGVAQSFIFVPIIQTRSQARQANENQNASK